MLAKILLEENLGVIVKVKSGISEKLPVVEVEYKSVFITETTLTIPPPPPLGTPSTGTILSTRNCEFHF